MTLKRTRQERGKATKKGNITERQEKKMSTE